MPARIFYRETARHLPSLRRGYHTPDPPPTRTAAHLPRCALELCISESQHPAKGAACEDADSIQGECMLRSVTEGSTKAPDEATEAIESSSCSAYAAPPLSPTTPTQFPMVDCDFAMASIPGEALPEGGSSADDSILDTPRCKMSPEEALWLKGPQVDEQARGRQAMPDLCHVRTPSPSPMRLGGDPTLPQTAANDFVMAAGAQPQSCSPFVLVGLEEPPHPLLQSASAGQGMESLAQPPPSHDLFHGSEVEPPAPYVWAGNPPCRTSPQMLGSTWHEPSPPPASSPQLCASFGASPKCRPNGKKKVAHITSGAPPVFSTGTVGHPRHCAEACKYYAKKRGCKDGAACDHCHLCVWRNPFPRYVGRR